MTADCNRIDDPAWPYCSPFRHDPITLDALATEARLRAAWIWRTLVLSVPLLAYLLIFYIYGAPRFLVLFAAIGVAYTAFWSLRSAAAYANYRNFGKRHADDARSVQADYDELLQASHDRAVGIITAHQRLGQPFALFLRSFDIETSTDLLSEGPFGSSGGNAVPHVMRSDNPPGDVEKKLAAALQPWVPLFGIANPSAILRRHPIPQLHIAHERWQAAVEQLVSWAAIIVFDARSVTDGVSWEIDTILRLGRQSATMVVLSPETDEERADFNRFRRQMVELGGGAFETNAHLQANHELLGKFPHVAMAKDIPFEDLTSSPFFAGLLSATGRAPVS